VNALADAWGVDADTPGKITWFTYRLRAPRRDPAPRPAF
jgi:hypothetical protein